MTNIIKVFIVLICTQWTSNFYACANCNAKKKVKKANKQIWSKEQAALAQDQKEISKIFEWFESQISNHQKEIKEFEKLNASYARKMKYKSSTLETKRLKLELGRKNEELANDHDHFLKDHKKVMALVKKLKNLQKELKSHEGHNH